jgi:hypothetical protein
VFDANYYHFWTIELHDATFGLVQVRRGQCHIYILHHIAGVPYNAPTVAAAFVLIVLVLLVASYYLIANLRHKSVPDRDKLD